MALAMDHMGERGTLVVLVKPEGGRLLGRGRRSEDTIKMHLK